MARVILGVGAGIAAYKACELLRLFKEAGHSVRVIPTPDALRFVGEPTWAALSGEPVTTDVWTGVADVPHVKLGQTADLVMVAPATADLLARAAAGHVERPAHRDPADGPLPGRLRPGDAHRDVGAPRHPGTTSRRSATAALSWSSLLSAASPARTAARGGLPDPEDAVRARVESASAGSGNQAAVLE